MHIKFPDTATLAHVGWGAALTLAVGMFAGIRIGVAVALGIAVAKEAMEALGVAPWEGKQSWASSLNDVGQFAYGIGAAVILMGIHAI